MDHHKAHVHNIGCDVHLPGAFTLEQALVVLLLQRQQLTGSLADLGQRVLDAPHLALVAQTILADDLQLLVQTGLLIRPARGDIRLREDGRDTTVDHLVGFVTVAGPERK